MKVTRDVCSWYVMFGFQWAACSPKFLPEHILQGVGKVPSEWTLLTLSMTLSRMTMHQTHESGNAFPGSGSGQWHSFPWFKYECWHACAESIHCLFLLHGVYGLQLHQRDFTETKHTSPLHAVYNKLAESGGCSCRYPLPKRVQLTYPQLLCMCLFVSVLFLHFHSFQSEFHDQARLKEVTLQFFLLSHGSTCLIT